MTAVNFPECLAFTLAAEGGYVDDPHDPGGATNKGVTLATLRGYLAGATLAELAALNNQTARAIYSLKYWAPMSCDALPSSVDLMVFDFGVNAGVETSIRILQTALDVVADGVIGRLTLGALEGRSIVDLIIAMTAAQRAHYRSSSDFARFGRGWMDRTSARAADALKMSGGAG